VSSLRRALGSDGEPHWLWVAGGFFRDLTAAGLGDDLAEVGGMLADQEAFQQLLAQAPEAAASTWPLLMPGRPGKALCLGKNFAAHAREMGAEPPTELVWFAKLPDTLIGHGEEVVIPKWLDTRVDPEAEVVMLLGHDLHNCNEQEAKQAIVAYTLGNDVTARAQQGLDKERGWPWLRAKNLATFGCIGPAWVPVWEMPPFEDITLRGRVNGVIRQECSMADIIWDPVRALVEMSRWTPLRAGDIVYLGTPAGVAPIHDGDELSVEADGLGKLVNPVVGGA
jgi:2-keto-4-pentenoate hydratase/2-oxohepta-3-ene-1,7-dioic acid hydratase in catechol pathway